MDYFKEFWLKRYDVTIKVTESCRTREFAMLNFTIVIYSTSLWFFSQIENVFYRLCGVVFLFVIICLIGLYIAKLNSIEQLHHFIEKNLYLRVGMPTFDKDQYAHKKGFNKNILRILFCVLLLGLLNLFLLFSYQLFGLSFYLLVVALFGPLFLLWYWSYFGSVVVIPKEIEKDIVEKDIV